MEGESHWKVPVPPRGRDCERAREGLRIGFGIGIGDARDPTTAPIEGTRGCLSKGRSSTMMGRPRSWSRLSRSRSRSRGKGRAPSMTKGGVAGEEGAVNVRNVWGGVLGVGGESTITMRSLRWVRVGRRGGISLRRCLDLRRWRRPSSEE